MEQYEFTFAKIDDHLIKMGVDIRPVFEPKLDYSKLYLLGQQLCEEFPQLFESLVQAPSEFRIMKKFIFPGNAEAEVATLTTTTRGVVFNFPRRISAINEEVEISHIDDIVIECLKKLRLTFPQKKIIRAGLVNEYIFDTVDIDSGKLLCERFTKLKLPPGGDVRLRINRRTDEYNRIIEMQPVYKIQAVPEIPGQQQKVGHGLQVRVDFNNIDMSKNLDQSQIYKIIHDGQKFNDNELYKFLNCETGGE